MRPTRLYLTGLLAGATLALGAAPALAGDPVALPGAPLTVYVGERARCRRSGPTSPSPASSTRPPSSAGDAGFFLAFPDDGVGAANPWEGKVYGFDGAAGPSARGTTRSAFRAPPRAPAPQRTRSSR